MLLLSSASSSIQTNDNQTVYYVNVFNLICQVGARMIGSDKRVKLFSVAFQKVEGGGSTYTEECKNKISLLFFLKKKNRKFSMRCEDSTKK